MCLFGNWDIDALYGLCICAAGVPVKSSVKELQLTSRHMTSCRCLDSVHKVKPLGFRKNELICSVPHYFPPCYCYSEDDVWY